MIEGSPRKEPNPSRENIVGLNQWFPLLDPKNNRGTIEQLNNLPSSNFVNTETSVDVGFYKRPLPVTLLLAQDLLGSDMREHVEYPKDQFPSYDRNSVIVPFNLDSGYRISDEDFDQTTRLAKQKRLEGVMPDTIDGEDQFGLEEISLWLRDPNYERSPANTNYDLPENFKDLNVALSFPAARLQTTYDHAWQNPNAIHHIVFDSHGFYTPEAPHVKLSLVLPADEKKLSQVQAKVFLSDSNEKLAENSEEN